MLEKWKATVVSILMSLTMISVGFSSWSLISVFEGETLTGEIRADQIVKTDEYLSFDTAKGKGNSGIEIFDYVSGSSSGFVWYDRASNGALTFNATEARITLYFTLKAADYSVFTGDNLQIDIDLSFSDSTALSSELLSDVSLNVLRNDVAVSPLNGSISYKTMNTLVSFKIAKPTTSEAAETLAVIIGLKPKNPTNFISTISGKTFLFNTSLKGAE